MRGHVAGGARVAVVAPHAAHVVRAFDDREVVDAGTLQRDRHADAGEAGADDDRRKRCGGAGGARSIRRQHGGFPRLDGIVRGTRGRNCVEIRRHPDGFALRLCGCAAHAPHQVDGLLGDHDRRCVGIAADEGRHHRRIDDAQPLQAAHAQLRVDDGERVVPHPARADRVIHGVGAPPQHVADFIVGVDVRGEQVARGPAGECRRFHQPSCEAEARDHVVEVARVVEERGIDARCRERIGAVQRDRAAAARPQQAHVARQPVAGVQLARMIVDERDDEVQLDVRRVGFGARLQEAAAFREIRRQHAAPFAAKTRQLAQHAQAAAHGHAHRVDAARAVAEDEIRMILQVAADAGQVGVHGDALLLEFAARADARQHQQLRRLQRAGREYDFTPRAQRADLATLPHLDADRARAVEQDAQHLRVRLDRQVVAAADVRQQVRARCAPPFAVLLRDLVEADAFLLRAVEIVGERQAGLPRGFQVARMERVAGAQVAHPQRAVAAVPRIVEALVVLAQAEVRQHVVVAPAFVAERGPAVVVDAMAADIDHRVDRRRTAQHLAARLVADAPAEARLRHRVEGPVVDAGRHHRDRAGRHVDERAVAAAAGLEHADGHGRVLGQPPGDDAAARTAAHDDVVESLVHGLVL